MFRRMIAGPLLFGSILSSLNAQNPTSPPTSNTVIRTNVNLVQLDAVVTDRQGKQVTTLAADDFRVVQDGKAYDVRNCSYISTSAPGSGAPPPPGAREIARTPGSDIAPQPTQIRRSIVFLVDDLALSFDGVARVRSSLRIFVEKEMRDGDLVAIIRTGAGIGALQQFTSDKRLLEAAIDHVRFNLFGRVGVHSFAPIMLDPDIGPGSSDHGYESYSTGSMAAMAYVVDGLGELPGRKSLVFFSESMSAFNRTLADRANRASIVIYCIDPRGEQANGVQAIDDTVHLTFQEIDALPAQRAAELNRSREGMSMLAGYTGGLFLHNGVDEGLKRILEDSEGYYLIGYYPDADAFDAKAGAPRYRSLKLEVKRPGLTVRARQGFDRRLGEGQASFSHTREGELLHALRSPFAANQIHVRLTPFFTTLPRSVSIVSGILYIDPTDLTFTNESPGAHKAAIDVMAVAFGGDGQAADSSDHTYTSTLDENDYRKTLKGGLYYNFRFPVRKPGAYQVRVAVRDLASGKMGSASQFIEVPDLRKERLSLSTVVIASSAPQASGKPMANIVSGSSVEGRVREEDPFGNPGVRVFKPGSTISYGYQVLNAQVGKDHKVDLEAQTHLYRDGEETYTGKPIRLSGAGQADAKRLLVGGVLDLAPDLPSGRYVLQIVVNDSLANATRASAAQSIDFEIQ